MEDRKKEEGRTGEEGGITGKGQKRRMTPLLQPLHHADAPIPCIDVPARHCTASTRLGIDSPLRRLCSPRAQTVSTTFASPFPSVLPSYSTRR